MSSQQAQAEAAPIADRAGAAELRRLIGEGAWSDAVDIRPGLNWSLPFEDGFFDYLLSWNALYYMRDETADIAEHIEEYARILKPGGHLVASVPSPGCFSLEGARDLGNELIEINTDSKWSLINGSIYYRFASPQMVEDRFKSKFKNFQFAMIKDDCFGLALEYYIFVCERR